jgi:steroid delta-isomerase-like uncharacterized protein
MTTLTDTIVRKQVEAFNRHDAAEFAAVYAADAVVYDPYYTEPLIGRDAIENDMASFFRAFPDIHNAILSVVVDGNILAGEYSVRGTHQGSLVLPSGAIPATGRELTFNGSHFSRLNSNGEIVEERRYFDVAAQLRQLGLA